VSPDKGVREEWKLLYGRFSVVVFLVCVLTAASRVLEGEEDGSL
jgi:hypothetical protein